MTNTEAGRRSVGGRLVIGPNASSARNREKEEGAIRAHLVESRSHDKRAAKPTLPQ